MEMINIPLRVHLFALIIFKIRFVLYLAFFEPTWIQWLFGWNDGKNILVTVYRPSYYCGTLSIKKDKKQNKTKKI